MAEINFESDLEALENQITTLKEELLKIDSHRENLIAQLSHLNGACMYVRGKISGTEEIETHEDEENLERTSEYPEES